MRIRFILTLISLVIFATASFAAQEFRVKTQDRNLNTIEFAPGEIVVKFKTGMQEKSLSDFHAKYKTSEISKSRSGGFSRIKLPAGKSVDDMLDTFRNDPDVEYAEPNYIFHALMTPNDPYYSYQWHMPMINMNQAWDLSTGSGVVVAVIDAGVAYENYGAFAQAPDLAGTNFVSGYDFANNDSHPNDDNGHGTHVAGTIAQTTNNSLGVTGIAFNCSIMPVKVLDQNGDGYLTDIADGIYYAADNGAHVINMSLGGTATTSTLQNACTYAYNAGVTIICAAGNSGNSTPQYPASYSTCISVSAVRFDSSIANYSSYGSNIDLCAPGGDVTIDQNGDGYVDGVLQMTHDGSDYTTFGYYFYQGTSMASPHVAGVAALILSKAGGGYSLTPSEVKSILVNNVVDLGSSGWDQYYGYGLLDAYAAVSAVSGNNPPVAAFTASTTSGCANFTVNFTDQSTNSPTSWSWNFGDGGTSTAQNPSHTYTSAGTYTVSLTASNAYGSDTETKTSYITVQVGPTASFTGSPSSGASPLTVYFTNSSSGATSYSWTFGDGGTSTATNPSHTYNAAGTYTVSLTATNACGNDTQTRSNYITVTCTAPVASFVGGPTSGDAPLTVNFTDQSTSATSWSWTFGDGGTSTAQNPSHTYTSAGTYSVGLTVTNSCGSDSYTRTNYITVTEPTGDYANLPYSTGFESGSFDQYWTTATTYEGRVQITSSYTPHSGSYQLTMDDYSSGGNYSQCEAWLHLNLVGKNDVDLTFWWKEFSDEDHTQDGVYFSDNGGSTFTKVYNLTGGSTSYQQIALDVDQLASSAGLSLTGTFVVKFQQYDNYPISSDGFAFDDISVISNEAPPVAEFSADPTAGVAPLSVAFTDLSTNNPTSWSWTFGDGGSSTAQNPNHTYNNPGTYTVSLTATNAYGSDSETKTGYITVSETGSWVTITYDDFESGMGNYTDGGGDMSLYTYGTYSYQGYNCADIQDNSGTASSFYHTVGHDVSGFSELEVEFYFVAISMETYEDFWVQYYDGSTWQTVASFARGIDFNNGTFYSVVVSIPRSQYNYPTNARLRFMCDASGNYDDVYIDAIEFRGMGAGGSSAVAKTDPVIPDHFSLAQNYPNPFNPSTTIKFSLPAASNVQLEIYNVLGQKVTTLVDDALEAGIHTATWDASNQASGIYLYRIKAGNYIETKKMLMIK